MTKREIEGVFSSVAFSKEQNEEINKKMNTWTKKELVQVIYDLGNALDKNVLGTTDITKALESFDICVCGMKGMKRQENAWTSGRLTGKIYCFMV